MRMISVMLVCVAVSACSSKKQSVLDVAECSVGVSKNAANRVVSPILKDITDPKSRDAGCSALNEYLRTDSVAFTDLKPNDCEWDYSTSSPQDLAKAVLERHSATLSKLCGWSQKDAAPAFESEGREIMSKYTKEQRQELQRAYDGR